MVSVSGGPWAPCPAATWGQLPAVAVAAGKRRLLPWEETERPWPRCLWRCYWCGLRPPAAAAAAVAAALLGMTFCCLTMSEMEGPQRRGTPRLPVELVLCLSMPNQAKESPHTNPTVRTPEIINSSNSSNSTNTPRSSSSSSSWSCPFVAATSYLRHKGEETLAVLPTTHHNNNNNNNNNNSSSSSLPVVREELHAVPPRTTGGWLEDSGGPQEKPQQQGL